MIILQSKYHIIILKKQLVILFCKASSDIIVLQSVQVVILLFCKASNYIIILQNLQVVILLFC